MFCYHPHTSPIQRLPVELLSYIFALGTHGVGLEDTPEAGEHTPQFTTENIKTPLIIASVNHHWRNIAHNTPSLWTSICVTVELIEADPDDEMGSLGVDRKLPTLNTNHLTSYLALSRNYPLDILIDARDQDWDFSEPEIPSEYECDTYTPPFSSAHMSTAISFLLPHLSRWRSIDILTDSWAPMYVALQHIQPVITAYGAPCLESLTLMRCNDFVSYSTTFEPHAMKGPAFLDLSGQPCLASTDILPRLQNLTLRGVHVDWASLAAVLSHSTAGLKTLELSSHCRDVRPTLSEYHQLLSTSPGLNKLVVSGSGPEVPDDEPEPLAREGLSQVSLPHLHEMTLGYHSAKEGQIVLELIDAPNVSVLTLEDSTYPGDAEDVDVSGLLTYLGTGEFPARVSHGVVIPDGLHHQLTVEKDSNESFLMPEKSQTSVSTGESTAQAVFPLLDTVILRGVKSCPPSLRTFFAPLPNLKSLELSGMSIQAIRALLPHGHIDSATHSIITTCPCPQLRSLCIRGFEYTRVHDFVLLVGGLAVERLDKGGCGLQEVDIHVDDTGGCVTEDVVRVSRAGTMVKVIREVPDDDDMDCDVCGGGGEGGDPFEAGGAFNDPVFDAHYAGRAFAR
ncbi:hypothetical protein Hypma_002860 [Hypsizygus marmoreus]|uniref:Uncharacterized protein n=1 Tax=Hypsizygus marmoreus TaxID=39966 RepID=A0A369J3L4_HYPMA|nr:hypothetical protein Hypma_002860 [Hypsizygus marmoreus]